MKKIAHLVHENAARLLPGTRQIDDIVMQGDAKPPPITLIPHRLQTQRQPLRVAILAAGADLRATPTSPPSIRCGSDPPFNYRSGRLFALFVPYDIGLSHRGAGESGESVV